MSAESITVPIKMDGPIRLIRLGYIELLDAVRDLDHLSPEQVGAIGSVIAHRLRFRSRIELARMAMTVNRELLGEMESGGSK